MEITQVYAAAAGGIFIVFILVNIRRDIVQLLETYSLKPKLTHCWPIADPSLTRWYTFPSPNCAGHFSSIPLVSKKRTPILEVVLEIGTMIVRMTKTAARTTVKKSGWWWPGWPYKWEFWRSCRNHASFFDKAARESSEPFSRMQ
jgi:hypothetical protein